MNKICPICKEPLIELIKIVATDRPYLNIGFHKECFNNETVDNFIIENIEFIIKLCQKGK